MRNKLTYTLLCLLVCLICIPAKAQVSFGKAENFNEGWLFNLKDDSLSLQTNYDDSKWRKLDLPHDWSIEGKPLRLLPAAQAICLEVSAGTGSISK